MYEDFYGFVQPPFTLTPDPRFLYRSESHDDAINLLLHAIRRKEGFIVLTGDIGTGKTTTCRALMEQLDATTFTSLILNPFLSVEELLREVLLDFGVVSRDAVRSGRIATASKHELISTLHEFLLSLTAIKASAVLIIDEAQHLSAEVLEQIRVISNLETNESKLLQIVLVGQLNLLDVLAEAELRQLDQRISIRAALKPLTREEVDAYIAHRLWVARGGAGVQFAPEALDLVHRLTRGVPRVINLLCDRALMAGAEARVHRIAVLQIEDAARTLALRAQEPASVQQPFHLPVRTVAAIAAIVAALVVAMIIFDF
jgi:general secretion pathway protein A